ncbi:DUF262 domain-containing protein [Clostridium sp.]|uniref:GmrSD restriction endonuclease domain-containing protein n=1 Tax=Clostridium sp. TaxID=1506 RepID=UPI001A421931|nr:DUF262 domain-containing protein [Clostridium sp.]MBK5242557.1 DUF262 domain-containing protein [Clostridium sp.]
MASSFHSNDISISDILISMSKADVQLPDFQRGWVWDNYRIKALIASISNSYPVGAVMFLEYGGDNIRFKYRPFTGVDLVVRPDKLVLDGQQRLTSIFCAMFSRNVVETITEKKAKIKRFYYLDIKDCLNPQVDRVDAILSIPEDRKLKSDFGRKVDLDLSTREKEFEHHKFPLNIVYDLMACAKWQNEYQKYHRYDTVILDQYSLFTVEALVPIQSYKVPVITLDKAIPKEAVCQVFENVNTGGVALTVFELVTATFAADDFELRKDWEIKKQTLNKQLILKNVTATDFLTSMTLLTGYKNHKNRGTAVSCKKKDVLNLTLQEYKDNCEQLTEGFIQAAKFLLEQRIFSQRDLPYSTQLIPMAAVFTMLGDKVHNGTVKIKIAQWYWCGVFGEMYGGANETRYALDVTGLISWIIENGQYPDTISRAYFNPMRLISLQTRLSAAYKGVMALLLKTGCSDFISGSAMDFTTFLDENTDIHHIFPRAYCEGKGYNREKWNSIVNKTPLFARTNRILGGNAPSKYLNKIVNDSTVIVEDLDKHITSHKIDILSIRADDFDGFFVYRAKALLDLIGDAMGKTISNRDSAETITAFGGKL